MTRIKSFAFCGALFLGISLIAVGAQPQWSSISEQDLRNAASSRTDWLTYGRDYAETRFSPLDQINDTNVSRLGLTTVWPTSALGAMEATPLVANGIMYGTLSYGQVFALDLKAGKMLWQWDPKVTFEMQQRACCGVVNRGVALYQDRVFVGVLDGRLVSLDARTGKEIWSVKTIPDDEWYAITMAPRVIKGKVMIGAGGAEFASRGYVSAYDSATGKMVWRFYTVPGDPSKPFENPELEAAARTWTGEWWKMGGGGTVWDAISYDPELDLMYVGTGNGGPWDRNVRSPQGGDNLFISSILALRPDTGRLAWYYQTTPGDSWDYTATQQITLADLRIDGRERKVLMQAPKNGFFYVLDRATGELLSAEPFAAVSWAKGIDLETGRPIFNEGVHFPGTNSIRLSPQPGGAHNWHPMSYSPRTGLVYIPGQNGAFNYRATPNFEFKKNVWNTGVTAGPPNQPEPPTIGPPVEAGRPGFLLAWDPVAQKERWRVWYDQTFNGGTVATAGNLVFHGTADGRLVAYSADKGAKLWEMPLGVRSMASPMTYEIDGRQYIAILGGRTANVAVIMREGSGGAGLEKSPFDPKLFIFGLDGAASVDAAPKLN
jgi:quinohemoprotein ethanol dehydrogenase